MLEKLYNELDLITTFQMNDAFIDYTKCFKYLGSCVLFELQNNFEVNTQITSVSKSMYALKFFGASTI